MKRERFQQAAQRKATQKWFGDRNLPQKLSQPKTLNPSVDKMEAPSLIPSGTPKAEPKKPGETQQQYLRRLIKSRGATSA